jgi:glycosyltransferase involved in cell wall biosynthesis
VRVIHLAPTAFGRQGLFGGGERYPLQLARALAQHVSCEFVTFGAEPEIAEDGVTRYLVPPGDVSALRERLTKVLADPASAARLGRTPTKRWSRS